MYCIHLSGWVAQEKTTIKLSWLEEVYCAKLNIVSVFDTVNDNISPRLLY